MLLYQLDKCPFAHRARIVLNEKGLKYEVRYYTSKERPPELDALSPDAKSPTLFDDDGTRVWESSVVAEYLDDRYPQAAVLPRDAAGRARVRGLMREADAKVLPGIQPIVAELVFTPAPARDPGKVQEGIAKLRTSLALWDARLEGRAFLVGDAFTLADVVLFTPLFSTVRIVGPSVDLLEGRPHLRAWYQRVAARPSTAY